MIKALRDVGLDPATRFRYPHEFSGGQRQRISIARAVVLEPNFVVLDEPTSALDMLFQAQMVDLLRELQRKRDLTYMFISHDLRVVASLASHLIVMRDGKVVEEGPAAELFKHPKTDYTRALFAAAFRLEDGRRVGRGQRAIALSLSFEHDLSGSCSSKPLDRSDLAARGLDARDGVAAWSRSRSPCDGRWRARWSSASRAIATWPFQKIRSPRCSFFASAGSSGRPRPSCCMSLSRGQPVPAAVSDSCTRPEQSMPRLLLPPHR